MRRRLLSAEPYLMIGRSPTTMWPTGPGMREVGLVGSSVLNGSRSTQEVTFGRYDARDLPGLGGRSRSSLGAGPRSRPELAAPGLLERPCARRSCSPTVARIASCQAAGPTTGGATLLSG